MNPYGDLNIPPTRELDGYSGAFFDGSKLRLSYRLKTPGAIGARRLHPLLVVMHGSGSIGDDNARQLFFATLFSKHPETEKLDPFVFAPQCPSGFRWVPVEAWDEPVHRMRRAPTPPLAVVLELLDVLMADYPIDPARVYIGGGSMGGFATWELLIRRPELFAAATIICGGGDPTRVRRPVPVSLYHGVDDGTVPLFNSHEMGAAMRKVGGEVRITEYPGVQHNSWLNACADAEMYQWLFSHVRTPGKKR